MQTTEIIRIKRLHINFFQISTIRLSFMDMVFSAWFKCLVNNKVKNSYNSLSNFQNSVHYQCNKWYITTYNSATEIPMLLKNMENRPIRLTQCCTQFRSLGVKILCALYLHYKVAFTFKWYGNSWNKTFYSQRVWIGYNIELAELVYSNTRKLFDRKIFRASGENRTHVPPRLDALTTELLQL